VAVDGRSLIGRPSRDPAGEGSAPTRSRRAVAARLGTLAGPVVVVACVVFVGRRLVDEWPAAQAAAADAAWGWLALALPLGAAGVALVGAGWQRVLRALGAPVGVGRAVAWYFVGEIGKYLPGSVWSVLGRSELARRGGVARAVAYHSVGLSLVLSYLAAAMLGGWLVVGAAAPLLLVGAVAALHPAVAHAGLRLARRLTGRSIDVVVPPLATSLKLVAVYVPAWLAIGTATWTIARALDPGAPVVPVVTATAAGWLVGFLSPAPGGVAVREAAFVATVTGLAPGVGAATAVLARVVFLVVDGGGAVLLAAVLRRSSQPTEPVQPVEPD
jgi:glycosyltransferase 2 family protein